MTPDERDAQTPAPADNSLEPYRRMVEMQRQIIELVKKHQQSKQECQQLREQVAHEISMFCRPQQGFQTRMRNLFARLSHRTRKLGTRARRAVGPTDVFSSDGESSQT